MVMYLSSGNNVQHSWYKPGIVSSTSNQTVMVLVRLIKDTFSSILCQLSGTHVLHGYVNLRYSLSLFAWFLEMGNILLFSQMNFFDGFSKEVHCQL